MGAAPAAISCGVAGWSYPDWAGYVYPKGGVRDPLRALADYVDMIEINSTFYRPAEAKHAERWAQVAAERPGFFFSAKLHQDVTHQGVLTPDATDQYRRGLEPLVHAGVLRHLLAQFRYDFADRPATRTHLQRIRDSFGAMANLVVEVRHSSWARPDALAFLRDLGVSVANLDYPLGRDSFDMEETGVGAHAYLRLHGRNRAAWFDRDAGRDQTYNYLYDGGELKGLCDRARRLAAKAESVTIVANNHYQGKEVVNALQLKAMLSGRTVAVPPTLAGKYPELEQVAKDAGTGKAAKQGEIL